MPRRSTAVAGGVEDGDVGGPDRGDEFVEPSRSARRRRAARRVSTAMALATSPARWPPMPSATAKTGAATTRESSFSVRTWPVSVAAPIAERSPSLGLQHGVADLEAVALADRHRRGRASAVEVGAVGRAEVLDEHLAVLHEHAGVELGDERVVGDRDGAAGGPADR